MVLEIQSSRMINHSFQILNIVVLSLQNSVSFFGASQSSLQNRMNFPHLAQITERYQISNKAAAALANAVLIVVGLITQSQKAYLIDKSKFQRERKNNVNKFVQTKLYLMSK